MTRSPTLRAALLLVVFAAAASACQVEGPVCSDLRRQVLESEHALPRHCQVDQECTILQTLPGRLVAARHLPDDPQFAVAVARYSEACMAEEVDRGELRLVARAFDARCQLFEGAITGEQTRLCAVTFDGEVVDPNDPSFELPPEALCDCADTSDCRNGKLCEGQCLCLEPCEAACRHVDQCGEGKLRELGLGGDLETCVATCRVNLSDRQLREVEVPCLAEAACNVIADCIEPVPLPGP